MPEIKLVVGLGNPGKEYQQTRHNVGFMTADLLAQEGSAKWKDWGDAAEVAQMDAPCPVLLAKPLTYMNLSGRAVQDISAYYRISAGEILVVSDDFALPLGTLRLRRRGSAGGHNGLQSIIECLASADFPRLRLGIGPVPPGTDPADFVLSKFLREERTVLEEMVAGAARAVKDVIAEGFDKTVSRMKNI